MDNVGIVVESLDAAISFFAELGLELEGRAMIEGDWSGRVTGLRDQRVEIAMMRTPDGHGRIELSRFLAPPVVADHRNAPVNALGYLRVMFAVDDLDDTLARLRRRGAQLVDEVVQYEDVYRLCYVRGLRGSSSGWPSRSARSGLNLHDRRALSRHTRTLAHASDARLRGRPACLQVGGKQLPFPFGDSSGPKTEARWLQSRTPDDPVDIPHDIENRAAYRRRA